MPLIEIKGHGLVEFPDSMSDEQIRAAIKRKIGGQKPASGPPGPMGKYGGVPGNQADLSLTTGERVAEGLESFGFAVPEAATEYMRSSLDWDRSSQPTTTGGKLGRAAADIGVGVIKGAAGTGADIASLAGVESPDLDAAVMPENAPQNAGTMLERTAEFAVPATKALKVLKGAKMGGLATATLDAAANAVLGGGLSMVHGADTETAKRDAAIAGAIPVVGHTVGAGLRSGGKRIVDQFFPAKASKSFRGTPAKVSDVLEDEAVRGLRAKTLVENITDTIDNIDEAVTHRILAASSTGGNKTVLPRLETIIERGKAVARSHNKTGEAANQLGSALDAIREQVGRLGGPDMNARRLNNLRKAIGKMIPASSDPVYRRTLNDAYHAVSLALEDMVPGARQQLGRMRNLITTRTAVESKIAKMDMREPVTATDIAAGTMAAINPTHGGPVAAAKAGHKMFQFTPGRMALAKTMAAASNVPGRVAYGASSAPSSYDEHASDEPLSVTPSGAVSSPQPSNAFGDVLEPYSGMIETAAESANVDPILLAALVMQESAGNPRAKSKKGAFGLTQVTKPALIDLGMEDADLDDPQVQLIAGAKYLRRMLDNYNDNVQLALAAYNAGPGAVNRHKGIPPYKETQDYVPKVLRYYVALGGTSQGGV